MSGRSKRKQTSIPTDNKTIIIDVFRGSAYPHWIPKGLTVFIRDFDTPWEGESDSEFSVSSFVNNPYEVEKPKKKKKS